MLKREDIRYHKLWVRLICCFAIACGIANAVHFGVLTVMEAIVRELLLYGEAERFAAIPQAAEIGIVLAACLLPALPRLERPLSMIAWGGGLIVVYVFSLLGILLETDLVLPIVSPLLGSLCSTALLETMAWSEERGRRRQLEALQAARQQFIDMLVHDLKKRMSSILMTFSMLQKKLQGTPLETGELMTTILASAEHMLILINNLLDIRKMQEGTLALRRESITLKSALEDCIAEHRPAGALLGVRMRLAGDDDPRVRVDREILTRILTNLLWNALQHAPADSEVEIGYGTADGGEAFCCVANRGAPIPAGEQELLFRPFATGRADNGGGHLRGTGLGLAFCKLAVEAHGGRIRLESPRPEHGDGVRVLFFLPGEDTSRARNAV